MGLPRDSSRLVPLDRSYTHLGRWVTLSRRDPVEADDVGMVEKLIRIHGTCTDQPTHITSMRRGYVKEYLEVSLVHKPKSYILRLVENIFSNAPAR